MRGKKAEEVLLSLPDDGILSGHLVYKYGDVIQLAYFSRLKQLDWIVITTVKKSDILHPVVMNITLSNGLVALFTLASIWFASFLLSRHIISPLNELHRHVQEVVNGTSESFPVSNFPGNEIGIIAKAIEQLTQEALYLKNLELIRKNEMLEIISKTDQLTGIANRRRTYEVLEKEIDRAVRYKTPFCILLFDIDWFKNVNDTHGHDAGDCVLKETADLVKSVIRRTDAFGRWGGEEFLIICPETSLDTGRMAAEKVRKAFKNHLFSYDIRITISMGVTGYTGGTTLQEMLLNADHKMYQAKQQGRDRVIV
jgi:diguanylate cyclase (GGDEF)-like protein